MTINLKSFSREQIQAWILALIFVLGFFSHFIGVWTGPIIAVWFVGTQRPLQGFILLVALNFLPSLVMDLSSFPLTGVLSALAYVGWMLLATALMAIPFSIHKLVSPRMPRFAATLPLPLAAGALLPLLLPLVPIHGGLTFNFDQMFVYWFAAVIVWMWDHEFPAEKIVLAASFFVTVQFAAALVLLLASFSSGAHPQGIPIPETLAGVFLLPAAGLAVWALVLSLKLPTWADRPQAVARLRSPNTKEPLQLVREKEREELLSPSGERFPIRDGIPIFLKPKDLTGANLKYNQLYEIIGGFYNDMQRVTLALRGLDRKAYFRGYMNLLEVKPGDSVLETSVGTGLNFKYLPHGVELAGLDLAGLDLSSEMLLNCQANLHRWHMDATLVLANAEDLPFADSSFDVVFHVGGSNFFNNRAKAILEMIRVAKPGSLLLIADETEKHVQSFYETTLGRFFKNRKQPVTPPLDLVPPDMQDIQLHDLRDGHFYALTFRKPAQA